MKLWLDDVNNGLPHQLRVFYIFTMEVRDKIWQI